MNIYDMKWSSSEKKIARAAFDKAFRREMKELMKTVKKMASELKEPSDIWRLEEYLSERREDIDMKYDYRYSKLIIVFSKLAREKYLFEEDLKGLRENKIKKIMNFPSL